MASLSNCRGSLLIITLVVLLIGDKAEADWWSDAWDTLKEGYRWVTEDAAPVIQSGWENGKDWAEENVVPHIDKAKGLIGEHGPKAVEWVSDRAEPLMERAKEAASDKMEQWRAQYYEQRRK